MNCEDPTPADPSDQDSANSSSSPPPIDQPGGSSSGYGLVREDLKLRLKLNRSDSGTISRVMEGSASIRPAAAASSGSDDDERAEEGSDSGVAPFSSVNAEAVRSQLQEDNGSQQPANNGDDEPEADAPEEETPSRRERRARNKPADTALSPSPKKAVKKGGKRGRKPKEAAAPAADDDEEGVTEEVYEVERILEHIIEADGRMMYKVKWRGYGPEFDTFEPAENLVESAAQRIEEYKRSLPVESREEIEAASGAKEKRKKGRGRPSNASKAGKKEKPRASLLDAPSDEDEEEGDEKEDEEYSVGRKKKATASSSASAPRGRGRPSTKGELKLFVSPKPPGPPKQPKFMAARVNQAWLDSDSDASTEEAAPVKKPKMAKAAAVEPPRHEDAAGGSGRKKRASTVQQEDAPGSSNGTRQSTRGGGGGSGSIDGMYRTGTGEVNVVVSDGGPNGCRLVPVRDAYDTYGWQLVQFLLDRCQFERVNE